MKRPPHAITVPAQKTQHTTHKHTQKATMLNYNLLAEASYIRGMEAKMRDIREGLGYAKSMYETVCSKIQAQETHMRAGRIDDREFWKQVNIASEVAEVIRKNERKLERISEEIEELKDTVSSWLAKEEEEVLA